jgi:hypothetical protein
LQAACQYAGRLARADHACRRRGRYEIGTLPARLVQLERQRRRFLPQALNHIQRHAPATAGLPDWHANCYSLPAGMDAIGSQAGDSDRNVDAQV